MKKATLLRSLLFSAAMGAAAQAGSSTTADMCRSGEPRVKYEKEEKGSKLEVALMSGDIPMNRAERLAAVSSGPRFGVRYDYEYQDGRRSLDRYEMEVVIVDKTAPAYGVATSMAGQSFTLLDIDRNRGHMMKKSAKKMRSSSGNGGAVYKTTEKYLVTRAYLDAVASGKETTLTLAGNSGDAKVPMSAAVAKKFVDAIDKAKRDYKLTSS